MSYVLIVIMSGATFTADFYSKNACEKAKSKIKSTPMYRMSQPLNLDFVECISKK